MRTALSHDRSDADLTQYGALAEYNRKRHFGITPEPPGRKGATHVEKREFVIQKHAASHLHYDLRLEHHGVMLSWAVPKGPTLDPEIKRLAMRVEDHPMDYSQFEGVIPEGEYGGGTVMIWDHGWWEPLVPSVSAALERGELKFRMHGKKLFGSFVLVRTRDRQWLLIKHRDKDAVVGSDLAADKARSVVSRRTMRGISTAAGGTPRQVERAGETDPPKRER